MNQLTINFEAPVSRTTATLARREGMRAMNAVAEAAGPDFLHFGYHAAKQLILRAGTGTAENATDYYLALGVVSQNTKSMGSIIVRLKKDAVIFNTDGTASRRKGLGSLGRVDTTQKPLGEVQS